MSNQSDSHPYLQRISTPVIGRTELGFLLIWTFVVAGMVVGDTLTTHYALQMGGTESNPVMARVISSTGTLGLAGVKTVATATMFACVWSVHHVFGHRRVAYGLSLYVAALGWVLTLNNAMQIYLSL